MDQMKEAIKEAMLKVQGAVSELQEALNGEEKEIDEEVKPEEKTADKAPEIKGQEAFRSNDGNSKEMVESAMGLDLPHQAKSSFAMKLKSKMGNKA